LKATTQLARKLDLPFGLLWRSVAVL